MVLEKFSIEIRYTKGPTFSTFTEKETAEMAREYALKTAKSYGFTDKVKKSNCRETVCTSIKEVINAATSGNTSKQAGTVNRTGFLHRFRGEL